MIQISNEQLQALSERLFAEANRNQLAYIRQRFPREFAATSDTVIYELINMTRRAALRNGVNRERDVATFIDFTIMYGEGFPQAEWAVDILQSKVLEGSEKMDLLRGRVRETGVSI